MLITTSDEIKALLPTSMVSEPEMLFSLFADAEEDYLLPVIGEKLYDRLLTAYEKLIADGDSVIPTFTINVTPEVELIRLCQKPIVYCALANSVGIFSVNLNSGGGYNVMEGANFGAADDKRLDRLEKDAWKNACRALDRVLLFLERDAKSEAPVFLDDWKTSDHFYLHRDLLFTTAECMNRYYNIGNSRARYIDLIPDIRYQQATYIAPQLGAPLLQLLLDSELDHSVIPSEPADAAAVFAKTKDMLRMALAAYVAIRVEKKNKLSSEGDATVSLAQAREYIIAHGSYFGEAFTASPMYIDTPLPEGEKPSLDDALKEIFDPSDPNNAISSPFGYGINRH